MSRVIKSFDRTDAAEPYRTPLARLEELWLRETREGLDNAGEGNGAAHGDDAAMGASEEDERLRDLFASAEERAALIIQRAREEAESLREEARRAGLEEGRGQGALDARSEVQEAARPILELMRRAADEVAASRAGAIAGARDGLLKLAVQIAEKIIRAEARIDRHMAARAVADALGVLAGHLRLLVHLNPVDLDVAYGLEPEFRRHLGPSVLLELIGDEAVEPGGCLVETSAGTVDARLTTQLDEVAAAVWGVTADFTDFDGGSDREGSDGEASGRDERDGAGG